MPSRGLHGPSKKKTTKAQPLAPGLQTVDARFLVSESERTNTLLVAIANSLARIEEALTRPTNPAGVVGEPRIKPSPLPGGDQEFISGQWHRRAGDVYGRVAEPGTPNAGSSDDDNSSGPL